MKGEAKMDHESYLKHQISVLYVRDASEKVVGREITLHIENTVRVRYKIENVRIPWNHVSSLA